MNFRSFMEETDSYYPIFRKSFRKKKIKQQKTDRPREDAKKLFRTVMSIDKTGIKWKMIPPCEYFETPAWPMKITNYGLSLEY